MAYGRLGSGDTSGPACWRARLGLTLRLAIFRCSRRRSPGFAIVSEIDFVPGQNFALFRLRFGLERQKEVVIADLREIVLQVERYRLRGIFRRNIRGRDGDS